MQRIGQYPDYEKEIFHQTFMRDLCCKLNKKCFSIIIKKIKDFRNDAKDCHRKDIKMRPLKKRICWFFQTKNSQLDKGRLTIIIIKQFFRRRKIPIHRTKGSNLRLQTLILQPIILQRVIQKGHYVIFVGNMIMSQLPTMESRKRFETYPLRGNGRQWREKRSSFNHRHFLQREKKLV